MKTCITKQRDGQTEQLFNNLIFSTKEEAEIYLNQMCNNVYSDLHFENNGWDTAPRRNRKRLSMLRDDVYTYRVRKASKFCSKQLLKDE